jgi:nucleotide-sensitive chloride channel 1A
MALRPIDIAPKEDDFTPLQAHQEQTPDTFFGGKPVLYAHYPNLTLAIPTNKLPKDSAIANLAAVTSEHAAPNDSLIENVDVWVTSR